MRKFTTTAALLAGAFLFTGCSTQTSSTSIDTRLDRIETTLAELKESQAVLTASAERLDAVLDEAEGTGPSENAKVSSMYSQLQTVRSQIELYRNQHNDQVPDLVGSWYQLTSPTDIGGNIGVGKAFVYGPYLQRPAINPFTKSSRVTTIDDIHAEAGWAWDGEARALFAIVSDDVARELDLHDHDVVTYNSKHEAVISEVRGDLAVMRNAIDLYRIEHDGGFPSFEQITEQLTQYTSKRGMPAKRRHANHPYGPYMRKIPDSPITGAVGFSLTLQPQANSAWAYDPTTGELFVVVPEGEAYDDLREGLAGNWIAAPPISTADAAE